VIRKLAATLVVLVASAAFGQEVPGADGPSGGPALGDGPHAIATTTAFAAKRIVAPAKSVVLPPLDAQPLLDEDAQRAAATTQKADPRVAVIRAFRTVSAPHRLVAGARGVETMPDGSLVWSAEFGSPGAVGLRVHVSRCDLPEGATLVAYDAAEPTEAYGPFEARGPDGTGEFFLPTVFGETERVEIRVPAKSAGKRLTFTADRLAQRYRERAEGMADPRIGTGTTKAAGCNNNVACDASYVVDVARAVATMEIVATDGVYLCTGALLNDSDVSTSIPYFLTAHHCLSSETEAKNTEFYFDYRAATCDGFPPPLSSVPRVSGATLLATSSTSDFTLMRLTGTMPSNRFFCGWTASKQQTGEPIVGVHHPGGTHMRISYGTLLDPDGNFHQVQWSSGVTAPGSSGSPLFNSAKQVIGQLYGGASSCADPTGIDEYGRFDRTYSWVSQWLGAGVDAPAMDSFDPADDVIGGATVLNAGFAGGQHGPHSLSKTDAADWFAFDLGAGVRYRFFSTGVDDVDATLYSDVRGTVVAASDANSGGSGQFSIDFTPPSSGRYSLKVTTAVAGAAAEYTLNYTQVDTKATKAPPAVSQLRKRLQSGNVTLRWRDRSRIETGYYVDISGDGGATWTRVAELPRNSTSFQHDPGPGVHLYRVGAWNATGVIRYRQIKVSITDPNMLDAADPGDDTGAGATLLTPTSGGVVAGRTLSRSDTADWYRIALTAGRTYVFQTTGPNADTSGTLYDDAGGTSVVASNDDGGAGRNFRIVTTAQRTGMFWLRVTPYVDGAVLSYALKWIEK
jgi:hypothetical protein